MFTWNWGWNIDGELLSNLGTVLVAVDVLVKGIGARLQCGFLSLNQVWLYLLKEVNSTFDIVLRHIVKTRHWQLQKQKAYTFVATAASRVSLSLTMQLIWSAMSWTISWLHPLKNVNSTAVIVWKHIVNTCHWQLHEHMAYTSVATAASRLSLSLTINARNVLNNWLAQVVAHPCALQLGLGQRLLGACQQWVACCEKVGVLRLK